jgi:outer membrane biosynthesis protein TonB
MTLLQRCTAPLLSRIPDVSDVPTGRIITIGIGISLLFHLLVFLIIALCVHGDGVGFAKGKMKPREIELEVIPPDEPAPPPFTIIPKVEHLFMDARGLDIANEASEKPLFESDENMKAASEMPANGELPLPGQLGKERPFNAFKTQRSLLGPTARAFAPDIQPVEALPASPPPPASQVAQQTPAEQEPAPQAQTPEKADKTEKSEKKPTENQEPAKPTKLRAVEKPAEDEIALTKQESVPTAVTQIEPPKTTPSPVAHAVTLRPPDNPVAKLTTPAPKPQPRHESGFEPEQEQNHIESSISNRGKSAVDSIATPMAKYRKQVNDAIGSRWYYYIRGKMDLIAFGSVRISFVIDAQGHVSRMKVDTNTSNQSLADVSLRAVQDAEIAPPPRDPASPISQEPLDWTLTFTYYPFSQ